MGKTSQTGLEQPMHYWVPSIAPSGMSFYQAPLFKTWQKQSLSGLFKVWPVSST
ncbi:MAG: PQQ-dependent sugar dehydrogenase [Rheinheimera sp.]|nr:PQQ-dependent sugar dehydrogenase [Rheinheimera sp.]